MRFSLEQQKLFKITQTLRLVHIILTQLQNAKRVNSVWDAYMEDSLKDDNKTIFRFLSHQEIKILVVSHQSVSSIPSPLSSHHVI